MRFRIISALTLACALVGACVAVSAQDNKAKPADAKVSSGERDAAAKIDKAKGTEAKLQAAAAFVKKYPTSTLRPQIAKSISDEIVNTTDAQAKISLAQAYLDIFNQPDETQYVNSSLMDAYISAGRTEEALKMGTNWLQQHPDNIPVMENLTILASAAAINNNNAYIAQGRQYGAKAIELLEADKMPAGMDASKWPAYRQAALVSLYRETGILAFKADDKAAAFQLLGKAAALRSTDPGVYLILTELAFDDYDLRNKEYIVASATEKASAMKRRDEAIEKVIETYAQAVAVTDGDAKYQQANAGLREDLEKFYKNRHNGSTDGLQQLIDKYKKPATQ